MKTINIEGIAFSEKGIECIKSWIEKPSAIDDRKIDYNIEAIERMQSFLIVNWAIGEDDSKTKIMLTGLQAIKDDLKEFAASISLVQEGGGQ